MDGWPELDELKQVLDVGGPDGTGDDWDGLADSGTAETRLSRLLSAAIARVKQDVGGWDEDIDIPDASLGQAALRMAELMALKPEVIASFASQADSGDPTYNRLIYGHRRSFGIA